MKRRVVVTGLGLVTPLGNTVEATWAGLMAGRSGAGPITKFDTSNFPVRFACEVKAFDPLNHIEKKEARKMGAFTHYAIAASDEAIADSGLKITNENAERVGTYISSGIGDFWGIEREHQKLLEKGPRAVSPFFIISVLANMAAGHVSIRNGAKGPNSATATACASGNHAIGDSFKIIQRDCAPGPELVAQTILSIIASKTPRFRYLIGRQARVATRLQRFLPERAYEWGKRSTFGLNK